MVFGFWFLVQCDTTWSASRSSRDEEPGGEKKSERVVRDWWLCGMSTPARRRLMRDFKRMQTDPPDGVNGAPCDNDIMKWHAVIFGPDDTAWEDGTFKLSVDFTEDYPNKAPTVKFITKMFHPNIYADGSICLDILQNQWSPIYDISAILTSIQSLLCDPNPNSPANSAVFCCKGYQPPKRLIFYGDSSHRLSI